MRPTHVRWLRRFSAQLLLLMLGFFALEGVVADAHDGESAHVTVISDTGDHPEPPQDGHPAHLCHCVHAHVAVVATHAASPAVRVTIAVAPSYRTASLLPSQIVEPGLRPPIA